MTSTNAKLNDCQTASIFGISENSLSVIFLYLSLNEIIQMSKSCNFFLRTSFKLLSRLAVVCKSVFGLKQQRLHQLINRCSSHLKHLDLSGIAMIVNDDTIKQISARCTQLTVVCMHGCDQITDPALSLLLRRNEFIKQLDVSGCHQLTSQIGETLSLCLNLWRLNIAWCTEMDANIVPFLLYIASHGSLSEVNLHCVHKFVSLFHSFAYCLNTLDKRKGAEYTLKCPLRIIGGLQKKTTNELDFGEHVEYLRRRGIKYGQSKYGSLSEYDFESKLKALLTSKRLTEG